MKTMLLTATVIGTLLSAIAPAHALTFGNGLFDASVMDGEFDKRRKPRIPGGSGCDDPEDILEHPECTPA